MNKPSTELNNADTFAMDEDFDPLHEINSSSDDDGEEDELVGYLGTPEDAVYPEKKIDTRPAEERIADLLKSMAPRRKILLSTLVLCEEPQPVASINKFIDSKQSDNFSVFSAGNLCSLLEEAGALERITAEGEPAEDIDPEPKTVVIDGVEYLEPGEAVEVFWVATEAGLAAVAADKPLERLQALFADDEQYLPIYKHILTLCAQEDGATVGAINKDVDSHDLVQNPRLYAPHFIDKLEKCDAVEWQKNWKTTEIGQSALELLDHVESIVSLLDAKEA